MALRQPWKLKVMFHTWPVKIMMMQAISNPSSCLGNSATSASTKLGKKPSTGIACRTSRMGIMMASARRL